jgi:hypothetical protein
VAHETLNVHGSDIAYKIRFTSTMTGELECSDGGGALTVLVL